MLSLVLALISTYTSLSSQIEEYAHVTREKKNIVALTFDDGPHPTHTDEILDVLREKGVKATFFVIGLHIPRDEGAIVRAVREGHVIGGHSYTHRVFTRLDRPSMPKEIFLTHIKILSLTGKYPIYFRFPYGIDDRRIRDFYRGQIIGWDVDAYDWKARDPIKLTRNILAQTKSGSIILLHDIKADTVKALPMIIDGIRARGLEIVPLDELLINPSRKRKDIINLNQSKARILSGKETGKKSLPRSSEEILSPVMMTEMGNW